MYTAFPCSEYHAPSDFSRVVPASSLLCLSAGSPYLEGARDLPRSHVSLWCYATLSDPGDATLVMPISDQRRVAARNFETGSHPNNNITGLDHFTLADCGLAPCLITLSPCSHLHRPKTGYGCGGSPLARRVRPPLSDVRLVAHRYRLIINGTKSLKNYTMARCVPRSF